MTTKKKTTKMKLDRDIDAYLEQAKQVQVTDDQLAAAIHGAISRMSEREKEGVRGVTGQKVFVVDVYDRLPDAIKARVGSLEAFKDRLPELGRSGRIALSRADLVRPESQARRDRSEIRSRGASLHYVHDRSDAQGWG